MKQWHFYEPVYRRWVVLQISSFEDFQKEMFDGGFTGADDLHDAKGMCIELLPSNNTTDQYCTFVWLAQFETATLVHEIIHLVMMCFTQTDVPISRENTEAFAFYTEYWYTQMTRARRRFPNGRKPSEARK